MYQKIIVVGNLGRDPEMRYSKNGKAVTNFSIATSRKWNDNSGQQVDETTWFRVTVWGRQAESVNQYLQRGSKVLVEGRMNADPLTGGPRIWTAQDGTAKSSFEITAESVKFMSSRSDDTQYSNDSGGYSGTPGYTQEEDEIPF